MSDFARTVARWQKKHGRRDLPWQNTRDPYCIWLAEVMLQQTQVATVIPYYKKFLRRFPTVQKLARAAEDTVMAKWSGLGYYARARNLRRAAKIIAVDGFPDTVAEWQKLPGIGKTTAAAIGVFSRGQKAAILDGNVKRVLARAFAFSRPIDDPAAAAALWKRADSLLPARDIRAYTQGLMDLGATVCTRTRPNCGDCPLQKTCLAYIRGRTAHFPARTPRPAKGERCLTMAAIWRGQKLLLEKRPPDGIWGALWSFPEASSTAAIKKQFASLAVMDKTIFNHQFTHFCLRAVVLHCTMTPPPPAATNRRWFARRALSRLAMPAPIRKVVGNFRMPSYNSADD